MNKPNFLKKGGEVRGGRSAVIAAGAGGLAIGAAIGVGAMLGFRYVMRGFKGIPRGRMAIGYPYGAALAPEDAAFPTATSQVAGVEQETSGAVATAESGVGMSPGTMSPGTEPLTGGEADKRP